jgi:tetratricopeptide (TPR) repeat protein
MAADTLREALQHYRAGDLATAERLCREALRRDPEHPVGWHLLGLVAHAGGRAELAVDCLTRALAGQPESADLHNNLGEALRALGRNGEAIARYGEALHRRPGFVEAHSNLGLALAALGRHDEALAQFEEALRLRPESAEIRCNLGNLLKEQGRPEDALAQYHAALAVRPNLREAHNNLGAALTQLGRPEEAVVSFREAVRLGPDVADPHHNLAVALLLSGRCAEGWRELEWRWDTVPPNSTRRRFGAPQWMGEDIAGRRLLIHAELGFGDTLQFCRYAPLAVARGAEVVLEVPPQLLRLVADSMAGPGLRVVTQSPGFPGGDGLPDFDLHCPMLSLPLAFGTTLATIPARVPYLTAAPERVAAWSQRLAALPGPRIGLAWAGNPRNPMDRERSLTLDALAPLGAVSGASFVSLQKGEAAAQAARAPGGLVLHDVTAALEDFADTAALVVALDLVISVDSAVAHLAGALGKPVWLLNRFDSDWRWLLGRADSPWYPSLRIFRQPVLRDWAGVIAQVRDALADRGTGGAGPTPP